MDRAGPGLLRRSLQANAAFSAASGLATLVFAGRLAPELGLPAAWPLTVLGVGLIGFAAWLAVISWEPPIDRRAAIAATTADALWVVGSLVALVAAPEGISRLGWWLVLGVAGVVALFALAQAWGLGRSRARDRRRSPSRRDAG